MSLLSNLFKMLYLSFLPPRVYGEVEMGDNIRKLTSLSVACIRLCLVVHL